MAPLNIVMLPPHMVGTLSVDGRRLSVRLSVSCVTLSREWECIASWKLAEWKPATRMTH